MSLSPLAIVGDVLLVVGFGLGIAGLAIVSVALALGVAGVVLFIVGILLAVLADAKPKRVPNANGPFERETAS